jgi:hypothetical protein
MTNADLREYLEDVVKRHTSWKEDFERLVVHQERSFVEIIYTDSGVGEHYIEEAFKAEWPDRAITIDTEGGCDSCGYGRTISVTISGQAPWAT